MNHQLLLDHQQLGIKYQNKMDHQHFLDHHQIRKQKEPSAAFGPSLNRKTKWTISNFSTIIKYQNKMDHHKLLDHH
jgi:hypothetical protein